MSGNLCEQCTGACCRYIALPIDTPDTPEEYDDIRWYLIHDAVTVFVEDGQWYISFHTPCRHLLADHHCGIYATRPKICRKYTSDNCDYHSGDYGWQHHFTIPEHLDEYVRSVHAKPAGKKSPAGNTRGPRRPAPSRKPQKDRYDVPLPPLPPSTNGPTRPI